MRVQILVAYLVVPFWLSGAQSPAVKARIDHWHGLKLGQTTPVEALQLLGRPTNDDKKFTGEFKTIWGITGLYSQVRNETKETQREKMRKISYRYKQEIEGFRSVELVFFRDKLAYITLEPKRSIAFNEFQTAYGLDFQVWNMSRDSQLVSTMSLDDRPSTKVHLTSESGPLLLLRYYYIVASDEGNAIGATASTFTEAREGSILDISLISREYISSRRPNDRPKAESILKD